MKILYIILALSFSTQCFAGWFDYIANTTNTYRASMPSDVTILTSANNFGSGGQATGTDYFSFNNKWRIRQTGVLNRVKFYSAAISTEMRIKVWRYDGSTYDLVGESEDISGSINSLAIHEITLSNTINVEEGDYIGFELYVDSNVLTYKSDSTTYMINGLSSTENVDWESASTTTGLVPIEVYTNASPHFVIVGDSIISGHPGNNSLLESTRIDNFNNTIAGQLASLISSNKGVTYRYQNLGVGSALMQTIEFNMQYYGALSKPNFVVLEGGVNDLATSGEGGYANFIANWEDTLDLCVSNNVRPIIILIMPWTNGTNSEMQIRDTWNTNLTNLINNDFSDLNPLIINVEDYVGKFRTGGDEDNLWDIQDIYDVGGIHYNNAGYAKIAKAVYDGMVNFNRAMITSGGTKEITFSGTKTIEFH